MNTSSSPSSRIDVVDALRGFAILSIMLLHNIEHFDLYSFPTDLPAWMKTLDSGIWETLFFLFSGKSYAIFALLFGFTYFIQSENQNKQGKDFRARFAWRLVLLLGFGIFNSLLYQGDILAFYALLGFTLIPVTRWSDRALTAAALFLLAQPMEWITVAVIAASPGYVIPPNLYEPYFAQTGAYLTGTSFTNLVWGNLTIGRWAVFLWTWDNGRFFQTVALFFAGLLLGRRKRFLPGEENERFWKKMLIVSIVLFLPLYLLRENVFALPLTEAAAKRVTIVLSSWSNIAFMTLLISLFVTAFQTKFHRIIADTFSPLGRMSLTNYIMQSMIGSFIYYGYGLGMYRYTGPLYSVLIGLVLCALQIVFCRWWLAKHPQGPLESLWHRATWM